MMMKDSPILDRIRKEYDASIIDVYRHNERRAYVTVDEQTAPRLCLWMHEKLGGRLAIATGIDTRSGVEILYHFMYPGEHLLVTVKTKVKKPLPAIESIGQYMPAAQWIERELHDILGVEFEKHPDMRRLIMSDDWPENVYPLRRDFGGPPS